MSDALSEEEIRASCEVTDGRFVEPCSSLEGVIQNPYPSFSSKKGIAIWRMKKRSEKGFEPSRTYLGVMCDKYPKGMLFNFCPFCGTDISSPFIKSEEVAS